MQGEVALKIPAARSAGIGVGSSNASSVTNGQPSLTLRRVSSSVQSATITSASGARLRSESRQAPRYGKPLTEATTTESEGSFTSRQHLEVSLGPRRRPPEGEVEAQGASGARP